MNIAIDGPSGAGKSTVAKLLSKELNILYLDTGALYRAVGLKIYNLGIDSNDEQKITDAIKNIKIDVDYENGNMKILLDNEDVSQKIREHHISKYASDASKFICVRQALLTLQQQIAAKNDAVLDGRDIATVVLPNAEFKFFLTADIEERAKRRYKELEASGTLTKTYEQIKNDIATRDYNDSNRLIAPLKPASDSIIIDSTFLSLEQVVEKIISMIRTDRT